jgi:outer membrane protein insertion porin family
MVRMKISKQRLENTRFFEDVNVTPESSNIPARRNLKVAVKEGEPAI